MATQQIMQIKSRATAQGQIQTIRPQPGQTLVLVVDGVPYTGQSQIHGKTIQLRRKGRALHLEIDGQTAFVAVDFFVAALTPDETAKNTETHDSAMGIAPDTALVDVQTLMQEGGAVQLAALDSGVASDTGGNIASQTWRTLLAQASGSVPAAASSTAVAAQVVSTAAGAGISIGTAVVLVAGVAVALGGGQGGAGSAEGAQAESKVPVFTSGSSVSFLENATGAVYTAVVTEKTGGDISYSISGGADSTKFSIDSSSGVVSFVSSPDFETPTDSGSNNVYDLVIQATESDNTFIATHAVAVTVSNVGDVAQFASPGSALYAENGVGAVYTAQAVSDPNGVMSYSISGGADSAKFSIDSSSGVVNFISSPNFETPTDAGSNNVYDIVLSATQSGSTLVVTRSVTVAVLNAGEAAPAFTSVSSASFVENGNGAVYTALAVSDVMGRSINFSISGGADSAKFSINRSNGVVRFVNSPDFEAPTDAGGDNVYDIVINATEVGNTFVATRSVALTVADAGDVAPTFTSGNDATFAENAAGAVYTAVATPDAGGAVSYNISGGADSARFNINSSNGVLRFANNPNHESATDAGNNNVYDIVISATEAGNTAVATHSVAVTVSDVGDVAPTFTSADSISASFAENGTGAVYTAQAVSDVTGAAVSYSISGGADSAQFSINSSGVVRFVNRPDFENATDADSNNSYQFVVSATEAGSTLVATRSLTVTVSDVAVEGPVFSSASSASFAENSTAAVYTAMANPIVPGAAVSYSISGGADSAKFSINSSGVVSFKTSPDFETRADVGSNNVYDFVISATEAGNTNTTLRTVAVTVSNVGDVAPTFTSAGSASFAENSNGAVYTAVAAPDAGGAVSYSISGGADSAKFNINSSSGVVRFVSSPDFETKTDVGSNNVYDFVISATEAGNAVTATRSVAVTVTNVGDVAPAFSSASSVSFAENATGAVYTAVATPDATGAAVSYSISGGDDSAKFSINSSGIVSWKSSPDFETKTDVGSNNVYDIVIRATEVGNATTTLRTVAVTVSNVGDVAPVFTSASSASFAENSTGMVYTAVATPDAGGVVSYSISGGADSAQFSINSSGVVSWKSSPDFETKTDVGSNNVYDFVIRATDAGNALLTATRSVAVTVSNVLENPVFSSASSVSFAENATGAVYTAVAAPDAGGAVSYSISGGADSAKFSINSSGVVSWKSSPDFETKTDVGSNNVYDFVISATEAGNTFVATRSVAVTVTNVGDVAPAFSSASSVSFAENATGAVYTAVAAPDVTGAAVSYSISGGDDSAKFSINSSGVVSWKSSPDFETKTDVGSNNVYDIVIRATDAGNALLTATRSVAVTVTDVVDETAPVASVSIRKLEATGRTDGDESEAKISALGTTGEYVVVFKGLSTGETEGDIFVQKFHANGALSGNAVTLQGISQDRTDETPEIASVGTSGEFVVSWQGADLFNPTDSTIFVQKFAANGSSSGSVVALEGNVAGITTTSANDFKSKIAPVGTAGEFVVVWQGQVNDDGELNENIFVQKFHANGVASGSAAVLKSISSYGDFTPQIVALGTGGQFVVGWEGRGSTTARGVFVQKFDASGSKNGSTVHLQFADADNSSALSFRERRIQLAAVGTSGEFVAVWEAEVLKSDGFKHYNIFVQKIDGNGALIGSQVQLSATGNAEGDDLEAQVTALGTGGQFVVVWQGADGGDDSIYVQKFAANGTTNGSAVQLEATGNTSGSDTAAKVTALGTSGEFVVVWQGADATGGDNSIYVQKFAANGMTHGSAVKLEAQGVTNSTDETPEATAVGTGGEFIVTWTGTDSGGDKSIFLQRFKADGSLVNVEVNGVAQLASAEVLIQSNELGTAYLVKNDLSLSAGIAALTPANGTQWNQVSVTAANTDTALSAAGLVSGIYDLYAVDAAGNLSLPVRGVLTVMGV